MPDRALHESLARELRAALEEGEQNGVPTLAEGLLRDAVREKATDIHVEPRDQQRTAVRLRIDGALLDVAVLPHDLAEQLENQLKVLAEIDPLPALKPVSARFTTHIDDRDIDIRVAAVTALSGERLTLRLLDAQRHTGNDSKVGLDEKRMSPLFQSLLQREGMLLAAGPTGCGKTTTIYELMKQLSKEPVSLVAIEDPSEYQLPHVTQIEVDPEQEVTFPSSIRAALRMDPDYLMLGELRDEPSTRAACDAATTGVVVFGTMHARDAAGVVTSLRKWNIDDYEISTLLSAVIAQRLVRRLCSHCRLTYTPDDAVRVWFDRVNAEIPDELWKAEGCDRCRGLGFDGRVAVMETWLLTEEDRECIVMHRDEREIRRRLAQQGHSFLLSDVLARLRNGDTTVAEIRSLGGFGPSVDALRAIQA
mgnify:CR=1 FL=1